MESRFRGLIVISGTPGVGKTTISKIVAKKMGYLHIDCGNLALKERVVINYDVKSHSHLVDIKQLLRVIQKTIKIQGSDIILDGHLVLSMPQIIPLKVFVLRCHPKQLILRLRRKKYSKKKISENIAAELLDVCFREASESFEARKIYEIDVTRKTPSQTSSLILKILEGRIKWTNVHIDWISRLEKENKLKEVIDYIESS